MLRFPVDIVEMEEVNFHHDSAVLLPDGPADLDGDATMATGLDVLAAVLRHADLRSETELIIAGHTDTSGADAYNEVLSEKRGNSAKHVLMGERDEWVRIAGDQHEVEDLQRILQWIATEFSWPCDPGAIDGIAGSQTTGATRGFQQRYHDEISAIAVDGVLGPQTWGAIFDMYTRGLMSRLGVDEAGLQEYRDIVAFVDDGEPVVGCGEDYPVDAAHADSYRSTANRRVEFLFFDPHERPESMGASDLCNEVYREDSPFDRQYLPIDPEVEAPTLRVVPRQWSKAGNVVAYLEAVEGVIPKRCDTLEFGPYRVEHAWRSPSGRLYFIPPHDVTEAAKRVVLVDVGLDCELEEPMEVAVTGLEAAQSVRGQMQAFLAGRQERLDQDHDEGQPPKSLQARYRYMTDNAHQRLEYAIAGLTTKYEGGQTDQAIVDEFEAMIAENRTASNASLASDYA